VEYKETFTYAKAELERMLNSGNAEAMVDGLLSAAWYEPDWRWVQGWCLRLLENPNSNVRRMAALGLGDIARIHRHLDLELVLPALRTRLSDSEISGSVEDALADIRQFMPMQ